MRSPDTPHGKTGPPEIVPVEVLPASPRLTRSLLEALPRRTPLPEPRLDEEFDRMHPFLRGVEALKFGFRRVEYTLSPGGRLRACARGFAATALALLLFAVLVMPALLLVAAAAVKVASLVLLFVVTVLKIVATVAALLALVLIAGACCGGK